MNDTRKTLLISYLGAVSKFSNLLFDSINAVSELDGVKISAGDFNYVKESNCFRTDFQGL